MSGIRTTLLGFYVMRSEQPMKRKRLSDARLLQYDPQGICTCWWSLAVWPRNKKSVWISCELNAATNWFNFKAPKRRPVNKSHQNMSISSNWKNKAYVPIARVFREGQILFSSWKHAMQRIVNMKRRKKRKLKTSRRNSVYWPTLVEVSWRVKVRQRILQASSGKQSDSIRDGAMVHGTCRWQTSSDGWNFKERSVRPSSFKFLPLSLHLRFFREERDRLRIQKQDPLHCISKSVDDLKRKRNDENPAPSPTTAIKKLSSSVPASSSSSRIEQLRAER